MSDEKKGDAGLSVDPYVRQLQEEKATLERRLRSAIISLDALGKENSRLLRQLNAVPATPPTPQATEVRRVRVAYAEACLNSLAERVWSCVPNCEVRLAWAEEEEYSQRRHDKECVNHGWSTEFV